MTFWVRFLEISADFHHRKSLFTTSFHYIFTTFTPQFTPQDIFTTSFHYIFTTTFHHKGMNRQGRTDSMGMHRQIFTTKGQTDREEQTPWGRTDRFSPQIYTTDFHHRFSLQIFTTNLHHRFSPQISLSRECDLGDKQTKINLETVASSNILIHSPRNSVERGCTNKFSLHVV